MIIRFITIITTDLKAAVYGGAIWAGAVLSVLGCSAGGGVDPFSKSPAAEPNEACLCEPGELVGCTCRDGSSAVRVCRSNCMSFSSCRCDGDFDRFDEGWEDDPSGSGNPSGDSGVSQTTDVSPCGQVPVSGTCEGPNQVKKCVIATGSSPAFVVTTVCSVVERCKIVDDEAQCVVDPSKCMPGKTECISNDLKRECGEDGVWRQSDCVGCSPGAIGVSCLSNSNDTLQHHGFLYYEAKKPNAALTSWDSSRVSYPAQGVLAVSYQYDSAENMYHAFDSTVLGTDGQYTIKMPTPKSDDDMIVFWALGTSGNEVAYALAEPPIPDGEWDITKAMSTSDIYYWNWRARWSNLGTPGTKITITVEQGSGAMRLFDNLRRVYETSGEIMGKPGSPVIMWMRHGSTFSCGACMWANPISVGAVKYSSQIFIGGSAADEAYWSDAVTMHELGHWVMSAYGVLPPEGGYHMLGCATYPGQAWSEGWATWFSSLSRDDSIYYDKQRGSFFWFDINQRKYSGSTMWTRPQATEGLSQLIDENEVAAIMWNLSSHASPRLRQDFNRNLLRAVKSHRMTSAPFKRGYTAHQWEPVVGTCKKQNVTTNSKWSTPMLADYLDALVCSGVSASHVDSATEPALFYPYPSAAPLCH